MFSIIIFNVPRNIGTVVKKELIGSLISCAIYRIMQNITDSPHAEWKTVLSNMAVLIHINACPII